MVTRSSDPPTARLLASWVEVCARYPARVLCATLAATAALAAYTAPHLGIDADENHMFSSELPHLIYEVQYLQQFPVLENNLVIVVDAPTPEDASMAAAALAGRMRPRGDAFRSVYRPRGAFFEEHALLYLETEELEDFADRLARFQPYLAALAEDGNLRGLALLMARGVRAVREGDTSAEDISLILDRFGRAVAALRSGGDFRLSWEEVVAGRDFGGDARRRVILAQPVLAYGSMVPARHAIATVRQLVAQLDLAARGVRVRITGEEALATEEMVRVESQSLVAGVVSFVLVGGVLWLALRRVRYVFAALATLAVGLIWTAGFAALAIGHLNLISVSFAVLFIGLGIDFAVHLCMRYQELRGLGTSHLPALRETAVGVGGSLLVCAATTAVGFYAFVPTDFVGVAELGLIAGTGMFISLFASFTLLPALLGEKPPRGASAAPAIAVLRLPTFPVRNPRLVASATLALAAGAVLALPAVHFDTNPLRVRDPSAESVQVLRELLAKRGATSWELNTVAPNFEAAEALARELRALPEVDQVLTVQDFVPVDQAEKLAIIEDVALFLAPPPRSDREPPAPPSAEEQIAALDALREQLDAWLREVPADAVPGSAERARDELRWLRAELQGAPDGPDRLRRLERSLLGSLPAQLQNLQLALRAQPISLSRLPPDLLERMVTHRGEVRVRILPAEDLSDNEALERFATSVRLVTPGVQGDAVSIYESGRTVIRALRHAFAAAVLVIGLLLLLIWRTLEDAALVMIPLGLAAVFTLAAAVGLGIPFNFADVIVLPLLLGIGVDSGVHLVHRWHLEQGEAERLLETSTARAVVFSSVTTIASFGSLAFASHRGMASLGQLLTLGVTFTVLCNLLVLPALIELRARRGGAAARVD